MFGTEQKHKNRTFFCNRAKWVVFRQVMPDPLGFGAVGPGNGIAAQAILSASGRSASLFRPQGALGSGPKPARSFASTRDLSPVPSPHRARLTRFCSHFRPAVWIFPMMNEDSVTVTSEQAMFFTGM